MNGVAHVRFLENRVEEILSFHCYTLTDGRPHRKVPVETGMRESCLPLQRFLFKKSAQHFAGFICQCDEVFLSSTIAAVDRDLNNIAPSANEHLLNADVADAALLNA